jgi:hypothetical protein
MLFVLLYDSFTNLPPPYMKFPAEADFKLELINLCYSDINNFIEGVFMKRVVLFTVAALTAGLVFAQNDGGMRGPNGGPLQRGGNYRENAGEELILNGKLEWMNGHIAVKASDKTYFVSGIQPLLGFVDGLKEGAQITIAGKARNIPYITEYSFIRAEKVTFNGKDYTLDTGGRDGMGHHRGWGGYGPMNGQAPGSARRAWR